MIYEEFFGHIEGNDQLPMGPRSTDRGNGHLRSNTLSTNQLQWGRDLGCSRKFEKSPSLATAADKRGLGGFGDATGHYVGDPARFGRPPGGAILGRQMVIERDGEFCPGVGKAEFAHRPDIIMRSGQCQLAKTLSTNQNLQSSRDANKIFRCPVQLRSF